jgi:uncharacterized iron-regulated membrane protein
VTAKKLIGQLHLWLGLASGLVVVVVALTGSILVFEEEIDGWVNKDFYYVQQPAGAKRLPVDHLLQQAQAFDTAVKITNIRIETSDPERTVVFVGQKKKNKYQVAVNPYTGQVIRSIDLNKRFFSVVLKIHRQLLMNDVGKAITGASCLIFILLVITGLVLWWPQKMRGLKQRVNVKWKGTAKRLNWDLHAVSGFYVHIFIFLIAITGLTWSYKWFNDAIFLVFDGKTQKKMVAPANTSRQPITAGYFENIYTAANARLPYKGAMNIVIPAQDSLAITISKENHEASIDNITDFLYFEQGSGTLLKERLYDKETTGYKVRRIAYPIHTGRLYGWPTKILAFISALVAVSLPITGFRIWLGKRKKKKPVKRMQEMYVGKHQQAEELQPVS